MICKAFEGRISFYRKDFKNFSYYIDVSYSYLMKHYERDLIRSHDDARDWKTLIPEEWT